MYESLNEMLSDKSRYKKLKTDSMRIYNAELVKIVISLVKEEGITKDQSWNNLYSTLEKGHARLQKIHKDGVAFRPNEKNDKTLKNRIKITMGNILELP